MHTHRERERKNVSKIKLLNQTKEGLTLQLAKKYRSDIEQLIHAIKNQKDNEKSPANSTRRQEKSKKEKERTKMQFRPYLLTEYAL